MKTFLCSIMSLTALATAGCSADQEPDVTSKDVTAYVYKGDCSASVCPSAPAKAGSEIVQCSKTDPGAACGWSDGSDAPVSSTPDDPNGVTSFESCSDKECGPVAQIGCQDGYQQTVTCGKVNGGACTNYVLCVAKPSNEACPDSACGPMPELARDCGKANPVTKCVKFKPGNQCAWNFTCEGINEPQ